jgi:hypothetical protein
VHDRPDASLDRWLISLWGIDIGERFVHALRTAG